MVAIISCCRRSSGRSGDIKAPNVAERVMKRLRDQRVRGDDSRQPLVELLHGLRILDRVERTLVGHRLEQALIRIFQGHGSNPGHWVHLFIGF